MFRWLGYRDPDIVNADGLAAFEEDVSPFFGGIFYPSDSVLRTPRRRQLVVVDAHEERVSRVDSSGVRARVHKEVHVPVDMKPWQS